MAGTFAAWRAPWKTLGASRRWRARPAARTATAEHARPRSWREGDRFLDVVIMASVVMFMLLAAGVGFWALQDSLH